MKSEERYPEPVEALVLILLLFGVVIVFAIFGSAIISLISEDFGDQYGDKFFYFAAGLLFLVVPFFYIRFRQYNIYRVFRLNPVPKRIIIHSIIIGFSVSIVGDELDRLINYLVPTPQFIIDMMDNLKAGSAIEWIMIILGAVLFASVSEEILFRGFLQISLEKKGDITRAVLLSSISWTLFHINPYWAIQIFIMGVIIGFLAWRTNSVYPGIIAHGINNGISLLFLNFELEKIIPFYSINDHVHPLILIPLFLLLVWSIRHITEYYKLLNG